MNQLNKLINWGVFPGQDSNLSAKIRVSNIITLINFTFGIQYTFLCYFYIRPIFLIFFWSLFATPITFLLNRLGMNIMGRSLIAIATSLVSFLGHITIIHAGEPPMLGSSMGAIAFWILPWLIFDYQEKIPLAITSIIAVLCVLLVPFANTWIEVEFDNSGITNPRFQLIFSLTGVIFFYVALSVLQSFTANSRVKNSLLIQQMASREEELKKSELELKTTLVDMKKFQEEETKRKWIAEGLAFFSELIQEKYDLKEFGDILLEHLIDYVGANQGGFFIMDDEVNALELSSFYAYHRKKIMRKSLEPGEGLLGQAFLDGKILYFTHIPDDYIEIGSGLGGAKPTSLLILPLKNDTKVEGIIELASFKEFPEHYQEFLEKVGRAIAVRIRSNKTNMWTQRLLKNSQINALEMRAQEKELRESLNALQEQQKVEEKLRAELDHKIQELEKVQKEIERVKAEERRKLTEQISFYQEKLASMDGRADNNSKK